MSVNLAMTAQSDQERLPWCSDRFVLVMTMLKLSPFNFSFESVNSYIKRPQVNIRWVRDKSCNPQYPWSQTATREALTHFIIPQLLVRVKAELIEIFVEPVLYYGLFTTVLNAFDNNRLETP